MRGQQWVRAFQNTSGAERPDVWFACMSAAELNPDFLDMFDALIQENVEFVLVGAHALAVHGLPRATGDIDFFVRPSMDNAERVMHALERFGAPIIAHGIRAADFQTPDNVYQLGLPPRRIDLLTGISGVSFDEVVANAMTVAIGGRTIPVIGRTELIKNKRASGRDKDLLDAAALEKQGR